MRQPVHVIGGGPAGTAAAVACLQRDCPVVLCEKSKFPRHKVCGEFLSAEAAPILDAAGVWGEVQKTGPALVRRMVLHFQRNEKRARLPEPAYGISRFAFDHLLLKNAVALGAELVSGPAPDQIAGPTVIAHGRHCPSRRGDRLFGFKAHFSGPVDDAIELFFFDRCYVGLNAVEGGITNVCGLAPETFLSARGFNIDSLVNSNEKLSERLAPLTRKMKWLTIGPLVFQNEFAGSVRPSVYPAGDALSFVDPFTGSGMLSALTSGRQAGRAAAEGISVEAYLTDSRRRLERPSQFSSLCRSLIANGWADHLVQLVPARLLVWLTRPHLVM